MANQMYSCTNCGKYDDEIQSCETCDKMACRDCLESDYWSPEPMMCAGCAEQPHERREGD